MRNAERHKCGKYNRYYSVCLSKSARLPLNEHKEWAALDVDALDATSDYEHGVSDVSVTDGQALGEKGVVS